MKRRDFLNIVGSTAGSVLLLRSGIVSAATPEAAVDRVKFTRLEKPLETWRKLLPPAAFDVMFEEDTERPFSSPLNDEKRPGKFLCAACFLPLFDAKAKYDSGTGWPSFYQPITGRVGTRQDRQLIFTRTEYHCARCGGHQGHVFDDGPKPTGQRWCNNGVALMFVPAGQALPPLRT